MEVYNESNSYTLDLGGHTLAVTSGAVLDATPVSSYSAGAPVISDGTINFGSATGYLTNVDISAISKVPVASCWTRPAGCPTWAERSAVITSIRE